MQTGSNLPGECVGEGCRVVVTNDDQGVHGEGSIKVCRKTVSAIYSR
jgi:hypothetical protein